MSDTVKKEWIDEARTKLDRWDHTVTELEARAKALGQNARADYHKTLGEAREHLGHAKNHLDKAQQISTDAWDDVKENVQESWEREKQAFEDAVAELRS